MGLDTTHPPPRKKFRQEKMSKKNLCRKISAQKISNENKIAGKKILTKKMFNEKKIAENKKKIAKQIFSTFSSTLSFNLKSFQAYQGCWTTF